MKKALFFDLDHTLVRPLEGRTFPKDKYDWEFLPGIVDAIAPYLNHEYRIVIITNQGGIEAKFHTEKDVQEKIRKVISDLLWNVKFHDYELYRYLVTFWYCPTNDKEHPDRKPNPGMILKAQKTLDIDLSASLFVGDMDTDRQAAEAAGVPYMDVADFIKQPRSIAKMEVDASRDVYGVIGQVRCINTAHKGEPEQIRYFGSGKGCSGQAHVSEAQAVQDVQDWHAGKHVSYPHHATVALKEPDFAKLKGFTHAEFNSIIDRVLATNKKLTPAEVAEMCNYTYTPKGGVMPAHAVKDAPDGNYVIGPNNTWAQAWEALVAGHRVRRPNFHDTKSLVLYVVPADGFLYPKDTPEIFISNSYETAPDYANKKPKSMRGYDLHATDWIVLPKVDVEPITV